MNWSEHGVQAHCASLGRTDRPYHQTELSPQSSSMKCKYTVFVHIRSRGDNNGWSYCYPLPNISHETKQEKFILTPATVIVLTNANNFLLLEVKQGGLEGLSLPWCKIGNFNGCTL